MIVSRAQWGAQPPKRGGHTPNHPVSLAILHHEGAGTPPTSVQAGMARVRNIQRYHLNHPTTDYRDIAYSLLTDAHAVYEGRDPTTAPGATAGFNTGSKAVCAIGDYTRRDPSSGLLDRCAEAVVWLWRDGLITSPSYTGGHSDYGNSSCPGRLLAAIPDINRRAAALVAPQEDDDMGFLGLKLGDTGPRVRYLQARLGTILGNDVRAAIDAADGVGRYWHATAKAVGDATGTAPVSEVGPWDANRLDVALVTRLR